MTAARAFLGMTHTPILGMVPLPAGIDTELPAAIAAAADKVRAWAPDRIVMVGPDHYNGFFNELMPAFAIGTEATAVGDYKTMAGPLKVDSAAALGMAEWLMDRDFDVALSHRMRVDHGFSQNLEQIFGALDAVPVVPIFLNSVAPPIMRIKRARALGEEIGRFLDTLPGRTLVIGSGGLSHEPPVPTLAGADAATRDRLIVKREATQEERDIKTARVRDAGLGFAAGTNNIKQLNPAWDKLWLEALESGNLDALMGMDEASIVREAGLSANESKTWLVARAAMPAGVPLVSAQRYYREIKVLIAGYGILFLHT